MKASISQDRLWYVARTNIKCEEKAAKSLRLAGYRVYIPKMKKTIIHHRTKKQLDRHFKVFNRYIFFARIISRPPKKSARDCQGVEDVLRASKNGDWYEVPRAKVRMVMLAQWRREFDDVTDKSKKAASIKRFGIGTQFQVRTGHPLSGFYGTVTKIKGRGVVKAMIEIFKREVPFEFEPEDIYPVLDAAE